ncbi:ORF104 [Spodoptera eridania nucleopolyhedrovirus]|uniref:ORF104 n=1 Tax=Spodoptera eridania nucleopolyhedrovirus TaxID=2315721 RepID=A0A346TQ39_9ABAC|nr:ORF104 [Spodoptera eridania nucleopolyhedrovirus]AXU41699.1 ORF104 [Spodoptera eridania nucleopolyhedrovirus]
MWAGALRTMWWGRGTTSLSTTSENTSFEDTAHRRIDQHNQVVYCEKCKFVAPMSLSFENYIRLHKLYNEITNGTCMIFSEADDSMSVSSSNLVKYHDDKHEDKTL